MNNEKFEALKSADEYLDNLKKGINNISNLIQEGREQDGLNLIGPAAEGIQWVEEIINLTKDVQKEDIDMSDMNEHIEELVDAMENEDYILVGDLFNYEVLPILERVHDQIKNCVAN